jgi:hypothetical protein
MLQDEIFRKYTLKKRYIYIYIYITNFNFTLAINFLKLNSAFLIKIETWFIVHTV